MTGWSPFAIVLVSGVIALLYTMLGGLEAVIWTDVIQSVTLFGGGLICLGVLWYGEDGKRSTPPGRAGGGQVQDGGLVSGSEPNDRSGYDLLRYFRLPQQLHRPAGRRTAVSGLAFDPRSPESHLVWSVWLCDHLGTCSC